MNYTVKYWYALQRDPEDDWGNGTYDRDEAIKMMLEDESINLIAVVEQAFFEDDHQSDCCTEEIWKDDINDPAGWLAAYEETIK